MAEKTQKSTNSTTENASAVSEKEETSKKTKYPKNTDLVFYGDRDQVTPLDHWDYNDYLVQSVKKQDLPGFDEDYNDWC
ncbi:hypothetical protein [Enterococcus pingfangensis]|uniref:hypothetical protein n=1 Tax=Enterococcus pingfangensis TaxID=2559924 RepID=UPI0010F81B07|nr:hypothetical protein [Enterococcus pingfangensis]